MAETVPSDAEMKVAFEAFSFAYAQEGLEPYDCVKLALMAYAEMTDAAKIAEGLSEPMRGAILQSGETLRGELLFWSSDERTSKAILRRGLIEGLDYKNSGLFTPLGLAVRKHLENSNAG